jgi:PEP-CTERM/exosortase A-associated glycosyltransferase
VPVRILHVLDHSVPIYSGYSFRTLAILREQRALGWETVQVTSPKHTAVSLPVEVVNGLEFHRTLGTPRRLALPVFNEIDIIRRLARRLVEVARQTRPDIIHAHSPSLNAVAALIAGRRTRLPLVYEVRALWEDGAVSHGTAREGGCRYRATRALETYGLKRSDAVTTICEGLRREIVERGVDADRVTVIPNAVDVQRFKVAARRGGDLARTLHLDGIPALGFIGSFYGYEGLRVLLHAVPLILARRDVRVVLVGGGAEEQSLKRLASDLGIAAQVIFTGWAAHDTINDYYDVLDILVYPRERNRLTELVTPLKPLEAMAVGRLVIASDVGGHRELIRHGSTGLLFRAGDHGSLASTVLEALEQPDRVHAICASARRFVESERTWAVSVARYAPVYRGLLERRRPSTVTA